MQENKMIALSVPIELYNQLQQMAKTEDRSVSSVVRVAISRYIAETEDRVKHTGVSIV